LKQIGQWLDEMVLANAKTVVQKANPHAKTVVKKVDPNAETRLHAVNGVQAGSNRVKKPISDETLRLLDEAAEFVTQRGQARQHLEQFGFAVDQLDDFFAGKVTKFVRQNTGGGSSSIGFARLQGNRLQLEALSIENLGNANALVPRLLSDAKELAGGLRVKEIELIAGQVEEDSGRLIKLLTHTIEPGRNWARMAKRLGIEQPFRQLGPGQKALSEMTDEVSSGKPSFSLLLQLP
jgi:hypothetical protein